MIQPTPCCCVLIAVVRNMTLGPSGGVSFAVLSLSPAAPQQLPRVAPCRPDLDLDLGYASLTQPFPTANTVAAVSAAWFSLKCKARSVLPVMLKQALMTTEHLMLV